MNAPPRRRILIVDDDRAMVTTLSDVLTLHGWETIPAYDGEEAVALAIAHEVDVVLMDVRMPRLDGVAALRAIKARRPGIVVVLMTAFAAQALLTEAEREGAVKILPKPVDVPVLLGLLEDAIENRSSVLVVDDDPAFLGTLCTVLAEKGLHAIQARTLDEALERMAADQPAAVLLDLILDHLDPQVGLLAIREVSPSVLLVLYSGHTAALSEALDAAPPGFVDAAFTKPLPIERLVALLNRTRGA